MGEIETGMAVAALLEIHQYRGPGGIFALDAAWGQGLLGDKAHSLVFDNTKIRRLVPDYVATIPFARGAREIVAWYDEDPSRQTVDERMDLLMDRLVEQFRPGRDSSP